MTEPVNLNKFRKARKRAEKEQRASENRVKYGRTKAEKDLEKSRADKLRKAADDHKIGDSGEDSA